MAAMSATAAPGSAGRVTVERLTQYSGSDLDDICEATESAIQEGGGFGWLKVPARQLLENYWKGMLLVPERRLVVGRLDGVIAGSVQLSRAPRNNEAQAFAGTLTSAFVAPWARGRGLGRYRRQRCLRRGGTLSGEQCLHRLANTCDEDRNFFARRLPDRKDPGDEMRDLPGGR